MRAIKEVDVERNVRPNHRFLSLVWKWCMARNTAHARLIWVSRSLGAVDRVVGTAGTASWMAVVNRAKSAELLKAFSVTWLRSRLRIDGGI